MSVGCRLFVGGHGSRMQGEPLSLNGDRCFSAAHAPGLWPLDPLRIVSILDSGAFTDPPERRLSPEGALQRQLAWERTASERWGEPYMADVLVSYDLLIDEVWLGADRHKRRWSVFEADRAVGVTVQAAQYLASVRTQLSPRTLMLSCQGVDAMQYAECAVEVLKMAQPSDWIGLGGWCILGRFTSWLPTFWSTLYTVLPLIAAAGVGHVHLLGVLYQPAVGGLVWLADRHGLTVSTDSAAPVLACTRRDHKKAGVRVAGWRGNVEHWVRTLADIRESTYYRQPPCVEVARQLSFA